MSWTNVRRVVTPVGYPYAARVREAVARSPAGFDRVNIDDDRPIVSVQARWMECRRCRAAAHSDAQNVGRWRVWAPIDFVLRPCDAGPCPNCDKWHAPQRLVGLPDDRSWDSGALRLGETVAWHELSDRSILEVAAFESHRATVWASSGGASLAGLLAPLLIKDSRRDLGFALAEAAYRNMLPTPEELRIACDLAEARGVLTPDAIGRSLSCGRAACRCCGSFDRDRR